MNKFLVLVFCVFFIGCKPITLTDVEDIEFKKDEFIFEVNNSKDVIWDNLIRFIGKNHLEITALQKESGYAAFKNPIRCKVDMLRNVSDETYIIVPNCSSNISFDGLLEFNVIVECIDDKSSRIIINTNPIVYMYYDNISQRNLVKDKSTMTTITLYGTSYYSKQWVESNIKRKSNGKFENFIIEELNN